MYSLFEILTKSLQRFHRPFLPKLSTYRPGAVKAVQFMSMQFMAVYGWGGLLLSVNPQNGEETPQLGRGLHYVWSELRIFTLVSA